MNRFENKCIYVKGRDEYICEDAAYICDSYAFVIDGAGGVDGSHVTNATTDATWFATQWKDFLTNTLTSPNSITNIIKAGVPKIANKYLSFKNAETVKDKPSAALAVVRIKDTFLEYFVLCDAVIIVRKKNGECKLITDTRLNILDDINFEHMKRIALDKQIPIKDAFDYIKPYILENRYKMNTPEGYAALAHTTNGIDSAIHGKIPVDEILDFIICSDGFAECFDLFPIYHSVSDLIDDISKNNIEYAVKKLYWEQNKDPDCNLYVRNKKCDDISVIYAAIN